MVPGSRRSGLTGSAPLIRLLARLADVDAPESKQAFAERLSQWLGWTDAISLSAALNGGPAAARSGARASASAEEGEFNRLRAALAKAIADDDTFAADKGRAGSQAASGGAPTPMNTTADFSPYRRRYLAQQQAMEVGIGSLRSRLRARLAARSPAMAQLAAVDAVMEQVLGEREHHLLSTVPTLLEKRFVRLRRADQAAQADAAEPGETPAPQEPSEAQPVWLDMFCKDMQGVLLAELDIRLQPVEGLLEALRKS